ncbi:Hpt domain-containing protein [Clavibacter tessellarius]|uniref:Hpt domain-containing protein n=1 Tax=Clavibacter tessellarius TaxID=31965 RepID=UPI0032543CE6
MPLVPRSSPAPRRPRPGAAAGRAVGRARPRPTVRRPRDGHPRSVSRRSRTRRRDPAARPPRAAPRDPVVRIPPSGRPPRVPWCPRTGTRAGAGRDPRPVGAPSARALQAAEPHVLPDAQHACIAFLRFYVDLWPSRWERLAAAVTAGDRDAALDACLSVKSSAAMVGALRLSAAAAQLESAIRGGHGEAARFLLAGIGETGERSMDAMRSWIRAEAGAAPD